MKSIVCVVALSLVSLGSVQATNCYKYIHNFSSGNIVAQAVRMEGDVVRAVDFMTNLSTNTMLEPGKYFRFTVGSHTHIQVFSSDGEKSAIYTLKDVPCDYHALVYDTDLKPSKFHETSFMSKNFKGALCYKFVFNRSSEPINVLGDRSNAAFTVLPGKSQRLYLPSIADVRVYAENGCRIVFPSNKYLCTSDINVFQQHLDHMLTSKWSNSDPTLDDNNDGYSSYGYTNKEGRFNALTGIPNGYGGYGEAPKSDTDDDKKVSPKAGLAPKLECFFVNFHTGEQIALTDDLDDVTEYPVVSDAMSIRCDTSEGVDKVKFVTGDEEYVHIEYDEPYWMAGATKEIVLGVELLTECKDPKEIIVTTYDETHTELLSKTFNIVPKCTGVSDD